MSAEDANMEMLRKHVEQLGEHFDSVHIFATRHEPETEDGTVSFNDGSGNWFARLGQVRDWLLRKDEQTRAEAREQ